MDDNKSVFDKINHWVKTSVGLKVFTIVFLVLILLIPVSMVESLIREREGYQKSAIEEVSDKWGQHQTVTAVVLTIPYYTYTTIKNEGEAEKVVETKQLAHFLPTELKVKSVLSPEKRYRGIYEVILYNCDLTLSGFFDKPDFQKLNIDASHIDWSQASITLGLTDLRSIQNDVFVNWGRNKLNFDPGVKNTDVISSGISTNVPVNDSTSIYNFNLSMNFNGSNGISFTPLGKVTNITVSSNWKDPSFNGAFLPDNRVINNTGFEASWQVLHLNRNYPQEFVGAINSVESSNFGVALIMPVDKYQKSMRSVKYAVMIISLTFLIYFFIQIKNKVRVHPIQFLIIGLALCLFFTLLIAISEHLNFGLAYLIGALSTIFIITGYSYFIFKNGLLTKILSGILIILYGFIYIIIQLQDHALLIGSIGLFAILSTVMYLSRNIDWYNINDDSN